MATKKSKRDKKRKARLSDKDILKLIKKLRPKNQQIVRVNVGDKGDKKGSSVANPFGANLVPVRTYAEPFQQQFQQQQPFQPPAPLPPPLPMSQQPQLQPLIAPPAPSPPPPTRRQPSLLLTDTEAETETPVKVRKTRTSRKALETAEQGYVVQPPREPRFKAPRGYVGSSLGATSSEPSYFQPPVQNDPYLPAIFEDTSRDSAGVVAQPLTSDEWTGTPEGVITDVPVEPVAAAAAVESTVAPAEPEPLETVPAPEETFVGRPIGGQSAVDKIRSIPVASAFAEEEPDWTQNVKLAEILPPTPPEPQAKAATAAVDPYIFDPIYESDYLKNMLRDAPLTAQGLMKNEIVEKLKGGYLYVPKEYLTKTGRLKTKITPNELFNLYTGLK